MLSNKDYDEKKLFSNWILSGNEWENICIVIVCRADELFSQKPDDSKTFFHSSTH